ncbi:MAG: polysaccharide deacetylase family protein [Clostridia bacterium]|nr:polysaccharide deacetylase family protein [Clostridia bacterium]
MAGKKIFTMSFDDGVIWDEPFIKILNEYGIKATFNLNSGLLGTYLDLKHEDILFNHDKLAPERVKEVYTGHEVASHSVTHPLFTLIPDDDIVREIEEDRKALSELVGYDVRGHAYPGGPPDDRVARVLHERCGVRYGRTALSHHTFALPNDLMWWNPTCHYADADVFDLAEKFLRAEPADGEDLLFYIWGHTYECNIRNNWDHVERFCRMMSGKNDVIYATNSTALDLLGK